MPKTPPSIFLDELRRAGSIWHQRWYCFCHDYLAHKCDLNNKELHRLKHENPPSFPSQVILQARKGTDLALSSLMHPIKTCCTLKLDTGIFGPSILSYSFKSLSRSSKHHSLTIKWELVDFALKASATTLALLGWYRMAT